MSGMSPQQRQSRSLAALQRDAALRRVSRVRRGALLAAAGLTAGIAPGRSLGAKSRWTATTAGRPAPKPKVMPASMPPLASPGALGLQGPSEAPQPAPQPSTPAPSDQSQPAAPAPAPAQPSGPV